MVVGWMFRGSDGSGGLAGWRFWWGWGGEVDV